METVVACIPSEPRRWSLHTTRSWEFIGREEQIMGDDVEKTTRRAGYGRDAIVGLLDSGIWPESESFRDEGLGPVPSHWRGACQDGDSFNASHCNRKLIGARYYLKGYEAYYGPLNTSYAYRSPRDGDGHGTHTASTVGGRAVAGISAFGGFANGTASGGAPLVRLAVYKVCWPIPGPNPNIENTCFDADMLAAIDDAIGDGVDVISISIGVSGSAPPFAEDSLAIGSLYALKSNVVVALSGGNSGPASGTVSNLAPWMITVGASSIDRSFPSPVVLGDGSILEGQTVTPYKLKKREHNLIYAADAELPDTPVNATGQCLAGSLSSAKVKGKIVLCLRGQGMRVGKGMEVKRAGGAAFILGNSAANGNEIPVDAHVLPATAVSFNGARKILKYIRKSKSNATASLVPARTVLGVDPAPVMAAFSSRGPNRIAPQILKPDVTAPGLNILAAWSESSAPTKLDGDERRVKYNLMSGTSMSCPHVAATAALLRTIHPGWSSAAVRSAIMTTATTRDSAGHPLRNADGKVAGPFELGAGHFRPSHASNPGLVYDAGYGDYLLFVCASAGVQLDPAVPCPKSTPSPTDLNHPSVVFTNLTGTAVTRRTVTNVGRPMAQYRVVVNEPIGVEVSIAPEILSFRRQGEKKSFTVTVTARSKGAALAGKYKHGSFTWIDGVHEVNSPLIVGFA
ncbi:subtilase family protein isoform X2 [Wolffia australiana]